MLAEVRMTSASFAFAELALADATDRRKKIA
jgi:hypothetical protein